MKDRSLEDFVAGDRAETAAEAEANDETEAAEEPADDTAEESADEAALATARWDAEGAACSACGETVERRWRADENSTEFVCADCKEW